MKLSRRGFFSGILGIPIAGIVATRTVKNPTTIVCYPSHEKQVKKILESSFEMHMRHWGELAGTSFRQEKEKIALRALS